MLQHHYKKTKPNYKHMLIICKHFHVVYNLKKIFIRVNIIDPSMSQYMDATGRPAYPGL